jgi:hypothetical protein
MRRTKHSVQTLTLAAALVLGGTLSAKATITLDLLEGTLGLRASYGIQASSTVGAGINANEWIGIYQFNSTGAEGPASPFWTMCLSPAGVLDTASHIYTAYSFAAGAPGRNPAAWAKGTEGDAGIQNAQYLWRLYSPTIIASGNAAQGAGLALAVYEALYDSTAYGTTDTSGNGKFWLTAPLSGAIYDAYTTYLGALNGGSSTANVTANTAGGNVLRSTENGAGQDMIWNVTPVPEASTYIAAALLGLPILVNGIRVWRKRRLS